MHRHQNVAAPATAVALDCASSLPGSGSWVGRDLVAGSDQQRSPEAPIRTADLADASLSFGRLPVGPKAEQAAAVVPDFALPPIQNGLVSGLTRIPTGQKLVFVTIDDGANKTVQEIDLLRFNGIRATLFLAQAFVRDTPDFFKAFVADGSRVEDHSICHLHNLASLPYAQQKAEICGMSDCELRTTGAGRSSSALPAAHTTPACAMLLRTAGSRRSSTGRPKPTPVGWSTSTEVRCGPETSS